MFLLRAVLWGQLQQSPEAHACDSQCGCLPRGMEDVGPSRDVCSGPCLPKEPVIPIEGCPTQPGSLNFEGSARLSHQRQGPFCSTYGSFSSSKLEAQDVPVAARTWPEAGGMLTQAPGESLIKGLLFKVGPMKEGQRSVSSSSGALPTPWVAGPGGRSYLNLEAKMAVWGQER